MNDNAMEREARLVAAAGRLGGRAAARIDVERTAQTVVERLRHEAAGSPIAPPFWARPLAIRIAAALVLLLGGGFIARATGVHEQPADHFVAEDLNDLSADDLRLLLATLDETLDADVAAESDGGLEGLNAEQLRELLRTLETSS